MPDLPHPLIALRAYLIEQGLVRDPRTANSALPPMFLQPRLGAVGPWKPDKPGDQPRVEDDPRCVVSAFLTGGVPARPYEHSWSQLVIDLWYRTAKAPTAQVIAPKVRRALVADPAEPTAPHTGWTMPAATPNLRVISCDEYRALTPMGADELGFAATASYLFSVYAEDLEQLVAA